MAKRLESDIIMALPKLASEKRSTSKRVVMKAKRVSNIARGRFAKVLVMRGKFEKTQGGIRAEGLMKNKRGKVVSKRSSAAWVRRGKNWIDATMQARQVLNLKGFVAVNGKSLQGKALYLKAKTAYEEKQCAKRVALPHQ